MGHVTHGQRSLWFFNRSGLDAELYNSGVSIRLGPGLDIDAARRSLCALVERQASLRTRFFERDGRLVSEIAPSSDVPFEVVHCEDWPLEDVQNDIWAKNGAPFDLATGPTFRAGLHILEEGSALTIYLPHIICDFASLEGLVDELLTLYGRFSCCADPGDVIPDPEGDYEEHAQWLNELVDGPQGQRMFEYWSQKLEGAPALLDLPTDRPRGRRDRFKSKTHFFSVPTKTTKGLRRLVEALGAGPARIVFSALAVLLYRYSRQTRFNIGFTGSTRARPIDKKTAGYMINMMACHAACDGNPTFAELLDRNNEELRRSVRNGLYPLSLLVEKLNPSRSLYGSPFYNVSFNMLTPRFLSTVDMMDQSYLGPAGLENTVERDGLTVGSIQFGLRRPALDELVLTFLDRPDVQKCCFSYDPDLYDDQTIVDFSQSFTTLLGAIVENPTANIDSLSLLDENRRRRVLERWNRTETYYPANLCFHDLFTSVARAVPEATAVETKDDRLTYAQLDRESNQLARCLSSSGLQPGDTVAVCTSRRPEMIAAFLGILKARCVYLPVDPSCPPSRLRYILQDAAAKVLLTDSVTVIPLDAPSIMVMDDSFARALRNFSAEEPSNHALPDDVAYVIYTSGSTGKPKGVAVRHRGLVNLAWDQRVRFSCGPKARVLQFASIGFDASVWEISMALGSGATLCLSPQDELLPGAGLLSTLSEHRITHVTLPPSALKATPCEPSPNLKVIVSAGEPCDRHAAEQWGKKVLFFNAYGPTETTVCATVQPFDPAVADAKSDIPIGKPLSNLKTYVLDPKTMEPLPPRVPGELFVSGPAVAVEYLNLPALTKQRFIPNPFEGGQHRRLYRTGDIARHRTDGALEFMGRLDEQVKIRGHRIEPGEIRFALASLEGVEDAAAIVSKRTSGEPFIAAYVVPRGGLKLTSDALRAGMRELLPEYMIPESIQFLESLPLTASGKVDKKELPHPLADRPELSTIFEQPQLGTEQIISDVWRRVLELEKIGRNDNFFDIGGHSLSLLKVQTELSKRLHKDVQAVELFKYPTISALAAHFDQRQPCSDVALGDETRATLRNQRRESMKAQRTARASVRR